MTKLEQQHLTVQVPFKARYSNFIGGKWVAPVNGKYFENVTPVTGKAFCEVARSDKDDIELALNAAHAAKKAWGRTSAGERRAARGVKKLWITSMGRSSPSSSLVLRLKKAETVVTASEWFSACRMAGP